MGFAEPAREPPAGRPTLGPIGRAESGSLRVADLPASMATTAEANEPPENRHVVDCAASSIR
jgi:hypothetical protein